MIRQLPDDVRTHLRSGVAITSVTQCTEELVVNALDAGATCIALRVDLPCFKVQVVDNGQGMTREQLSQVGDRYSTSKCHELEDLNNLQYFGYRGEAIASIRDTAAILEINSRTNQSHQTYCRMFKRGTAISVSESVDQRPSAGTTITVHDLFYSLPVRRKAVNEALELEKVRYRIEGIALIHPSVSFSLRNDVTGHILLQTKKSSNTLTSFTHLFGHGKAKSLREVSVQKDNFDVEGYIGKEGHSNKNLQFVFVNGRLILKTRIHKILNHILGKSLVLKKKGSSSEYNSSKSPAQEARGSSPTKQGEKYAIFVLNVKCPLDVYDITFDPAKTLVEFKEWSTLTNAIDEMIINFLKKENLLSLSDMSSLSPLASGTEGSTNSTAVKTTASDEEDQTEEGDEESKVSSAQKTQTEDIHRSSGDKNPAVRDYTENISTQNATNYLISSTVRRPFYLSDEMVENLENFKENGMDTFDKNTINVESVTEETLVIQETPMTGASESNQINPQTSEISSKSVESSECKSDTSVETSSEKKSSDCSLDTTSTLERNVSESGQTSASSINTESVSDEDCEPCFTEVKKPMQLTSPTAESEDPFPRTLREPKPGNMSTSCSNKGSREQRSEKKALICLPGSPPTSSAMNVSRLQNLKLLSSKPNYSAAQMMSKRLGLTSTVQKSAAQKISERLGLTGKKVISEKLQKFKNTNVLSKQNIVKGNPSHLAPSDQDVTHNDNRQVLATPVKQQTDPLTQSSVCDHNRNNMSHEAAPVSVSSIKACSQMSKNQKIISSSASDTERDPVVPTIADIDFLTSRSETAARKRFNPFALSTASKLSKLARKNDSTDSAAPVTKQREFLSTSSLLETPVSIFKTREDKKLDDLTESSNRQEPTFSQVDIKLAQRDVSFEKIHSSNQGITTLESSSQATADKLGSDSVSLNNHHLDYTRMFVTSESVHIPKDRNKLPFDAYSHMDSMTEEKVPEMDVSEAESVESVVLPHRDCFSPVMSEEDPKRLPSPDISTQAFQLTVQPSQGFTPDIKMYEEDGESGGFSPRNLDEILQSTASPNVPCATDNLQEVSSPERCFSDEIVANSECHKKPLQVSSLSSGCEKAVYEITYADISLGSTAGNNTKDKIDAPLSTSKEYTESASTSFGQQVSKSEQDNTEDSDSFPLRALLPSDSQQSDLMLCTSETYSDKKNSGSESQVNHALQMQSDVIDSSVTLDDSVMKDTNEIDEHLAKEFDSEMSEEKHVGSREVTGDKPCTSRETITPASNRYACKAMTSCQATHDLDCGQMNPTSTISDVQPSCSTAGLHSEPKHSSLWSERLDPKTGKKIYVNSLTGNTMFEDQWMECEVNEELPSESVNTKLQNTVSTVHLSGSEREKLHNLLDCHLETSDDQVKWRQPSTSSTSQSLTDEQSTIEDLFLSWDNPVLNIPQQSCVNCEVSHASRAATQSYQSLYPTKFTKAMLRTVEVLGQVDNKFIACVLNTNDKNIAQAPDLIVLFDQHAVHERVRLEQLTEDIYIDSDDITNCCIKQSQVSPPKTLTFTEEEVRLIKSFREDFKRIGVTFTINGSSRDSLNVHSIPACLVEREANEIKRGRDSVAMDIAESLIKDHLEMLRVTGGARNRLPQTIHKVLCSQACHGAIKFGDSLSLSQCGELLDSLSHCDLPFQCAHGRPSVMPLLGLEQLKAKLPPQRLKRPNLWKISKNLPIHQ